MFLDKQELREFISNTHLLKEFFESSIFLEERKWSFQEDLRC